MPVIRLLCKYKQIRSFQFDAKMRSINNLHRILKRLKQKLMNWWYPKYCIICKQVIHRPFLVCETPNCRLLYCENCFTDYITGCVLCGKK